MFIQVHNIKREILSATYSIITISNLAQYSEMRNDVMEKTDLLYLYSNIREHWRRKFKNSCLYGITHNFAAMYSKASDKYIKFIQKFK